LAGTLGYMHYLVTIPLLNTNYAPGRFETFIVIPGAFLLMLYGVFFLCSLAKEGGQRNTVLIIAALFLIGFSVTNIESQYNGTYTAAGRMPQDEALLEMQSWVEANTDNNAVFLSHDELAFALNGLTGRKVVTERRTHYNPYVDFDERSADSAVILYGNDSGKALGLLRKYNVSYVYWDVNYLSFSQRVPMLIRPKYGDYLDSYGIKYQSVNWFLDPAFDQKTYKKYPVLSVQTAKQDWQQPWSDELQKHLRLAKEVEMQLQTSDGQSFIGPGYRIYEIDYSSF